MYRYTDKFVTVESVTSGHPDKVCDQMSDAILDAYLAQDPNSRVAIETFGAHGTLMIGGEVTSTGVIDAGKIAQAKYEEIGYTDKLEIITRIEQQSPDIAMGVDTGGAGDQGIMYGYACDETPEALPLPIVLVQRLAYNLELLRRANPEVLGPDGKTQLCFDKGKLTTVLVSTQHAENAEIEKVRTMVRDGLITPTLREYLTPETIILINPTGRFVHGGFVADTGLTGRKIMVDTYCGLVPHGGGAFSGKDATKVDRSAAYFCRYVAKKVIEAGFAKECLISVAYAIGQAEPLMIHAECDDSADQKTVDKFVSGFDFKPRAIIETLNLKRPMYSGLAAYGHFGRTEF